MNVEAIARYVVCVVGEDQSEINSASLSLSLGQLAENCRRSLNASLSLCRSTTTLRFAVISKDASRSLNDANFHIRFSCLRHSSPFSFSHMS